MKFNDSIFSYLQEITANPVPTRHITSMDEYKSELEKLLPIKHPFDFVEFEECDLLRAAFLFQTKISGGGTRKEKIIHAFKDAACKIANGEEFTGFRLDTQDHFGINLEVREDGEDINASLDSMRRCLKDSNIVNLMLLRSTFIFLPTLGVAI